MTTLKTTGSTVLCLEPLFQTEAQLVPKVANIGAQQIVVLQTLQIQIMLQTNNCGGKQHFASRLRPRDEWCVRKDR